MLLFFFSFFSDFNSKFFLDFFFLLESRTNNGAKFNFIGIKKLRVSQMPEGSDRLSNSKV